MTWVCRIPNCPQYGVEQAAVDPKQAWRSHWARNHQERPR